MASCGAVRTRNESGTARRRRISSTRRQTPYSRPRELREPTVTVRPALSADEAISYASRAGSGTSRRPPSPSPPAETRQWMTLRADAAPRPVLSVQPTSRRESRRYPMAVRRIAASTPSNTAATVPVTAPSRRPRRPHSSWIVVSCTRSTGVSAVPWYS